MATKAKAVTAETIYDSARDQGLDRDEVVIKMHSELGLSLNQAQAEFKKIAKARGDASAVATGFRAELYALLKQGPLDEDTFVAMVEKASPNTKRHIKHFDAIRQLTNEVWANK